VTLAILGIVGTAAGFIARWLYRRWARADDPLEQHRRRYRDIDRQIISRASESVTRGASADLDELERLRIAKGGDHSKR
jgi:hypothetical protein